SSGRAMTGGSVGKGPAFDADWMSKETCADGPQPPFACNPTPYRTSDGTCNNLNHPYKWGVALRPFRRVIQPDYADGVSAPRVSSDGGALPSAREVSVTVHRPLYQDDPDFTVMLAVWGQFMDHDITATALSQGKRVRGELGEIMAFEGLGPQAKERSRDPIPEIILLKIGSVGGKSISCCKVFTSHSSVDQHPECFPVPLADGDPFYNQWNISCMEFVRSAPAPSCHFGPREQLNQASSYLDGSVVYGPYDSVVNKLRSFQGGQLRMYTTEDGRTLLPTSTDPTDGCNQQEEALKGRYCFESGDPRANENLHLTTMHLILARQHNRVAQQLSQLNPVWSDERLFQESRRIVVAQMQHITYNEFLPIILGDHLMDSLELRPKTSGYFTGYNATVDVTVANHFATAAFRFAHTLLPGLAKMLGNDTSSTEYVEMHKMLFNPFRLYSPGQLDNTLRGALNTTMQKFNPHFSNEVTEHLFERPVAVKGPFPCGLDLVSLNIQRGRDHGLPSYPVWRELCGLTRPASFEDLQGVMNPDSIQHISLIYKRILSRRPFSVECELMALAPYHKPLNLFWCRNSHPATIYVVMGFPGDVIATLETVWRLNKTSRDRNRSRP
ncbi:unnamed protein product, partial [Timema podura]|nr:unnamed protein product [Timema podura]